VRLANRVAHNSCCATRGAGSESNLKSMISRKRHFALYSFHAVSNPTTHRGRGCRSLGRFRRGRGEVVEVEGRVGWREPPAAEPAWRREALPPLPEPAARSRRSAGRGGRRLACEAMAAARPGWAEPETRVRAPQRDFRRWAGASARRELRRRGAAPKNRG